MGTVGVPDAWSDLATQDEFKRSRRVGRVWLVIAVVLFSGFSVYATRLQDHADALVAHGVRTRGVVLEDPPEAIRCGQVPVPVAFDVDGQYQVHTYYVDGCGSGGLSKNKRVAVSYDRADPNDFVVNGNPNEKPLPTLLAIVALVASGLLSGGWAIRARRLHVLRRTLHQTPWADTPVRIAPINSRLTKRRWAVEVTEPSGRAELFVTQPATRRMLDAGTEQQLRIAGSGAARAARPQTSGRLVLARRPRTKTGRERARRAFEGRGTTTAAT